MTDRTQKGRVGEPERPPQVPSQRKHSDRTAGTNRDFDETGEPENQAHGHPREERGQGSKQR